MVAYYLDTSALVKRHAVEIGSPWIISITDPIAQHDLYMGLITGPEMIAALFRKARTGAIDQAAAILASRGASKSCQKS